MTLLVVGLILFVGTHLLPTVPSLRLAILARIGDGAYKALFSLASAIGLALIVTGFGDASRERVFAPFAVAQAIAPAANTLALVLFAAANLRTYLRRWVRHPMLLGLLTWSTVHLLATGDTRGTVLFGTLALYALIDLASAIARGGVRPFTPGGRYDAMAVAGGVVLAVVVMYFHRPLFGVAVVAFGK